MALAMHEFPHWVEQDQRQAGIISIQTAIGTAHYHKKKTRPQQPHSDITETAILDASITIQQLTS
jgi:hypothetical protein